MFKGKSFHATLFVTNILAILYIILSFLLFYSSFVCVCVFTVYVLNFWYNVTSEYNFTGSLYQQTSIAFTKFNPNVSMRFFLLCL